MATIQQSDDLDRRFQQRATARLAWTHYQDEVEGLMAANVPFAQVEDAINNTDLADDAKSALWLLAWSLREPSIQQEDARLTLAMIATHEG